MRLHLYMHVYQFLPDVRMVKGVNEHAPYIRDEMAYIAYACTACTTQLCILDVFMHNSCIYLVALLTASLSHLHRPMPAVNKCMHASTRKQIITACRTIPINKIIRVAVNACTIPKHAHTHTHTLTHPQTILYDSLCKWFNNMPTKD